MERDFGIYRQQSGANFNLPVDQVLFILHLQRLKLLMKLSKEPTNVPKEDPCCETSLDEIELFCFDTALKCQVR